MSTVLKHITISELQNLVLEAHLPADLRMSVDFEDKVVAQAAIQRYRALEAMKKLKGSGNGNLVSRLLDERRKDRIK